MSKPRTNLICHNRLHIHEAANIERKQMTVFNDRPWLSIQKVHRETLRGLRAMAPCPPVVLARVGEDAAGGPRCFHSFKRRDKTTCFARRKWIEVFNGPLDQNPAVRHGTRFATDGIDSARGMPIARRLTPRRCEIRAVQGRHPEPAPVHRPFRRGFAIDSRIQFRRFNLPNRSTMTVFALLESEFAGCADGADDVLSSPPQFLWVIGLVA
jgi:hypothetical protein